MDIFTHALLPVILVGAIAKRPDLRGRWQLVSIGIAGALPDILCPHLSLEARMASWSHGIPCWFMLTIVMLMISYFSRRRIAAGFASLLSGAYFLHMMCDAISGGVNFFHPFGNGSWGDYWVDPIWWIPLDIACFLTVYFMFRVAPRMRALKQSRQTSLQGGLLESATDSNATGWDSNER